MKKYIFVGMNVGGINGAAQYLHNKINFVKKQGYQTFFFSGRHGKILIETFREYENLTHPALRFYPYTLRQKELDSTLAWMLSVIDAKPGDTCIVESSNAISSLWGELIAKELQCKHLPIIMQEHHAYSPSMRQFLRFKYDRHELSGIFDNSVRDMLQDQTLPLRPDTRVRAYCNNVVQECPDNYSHLFDPQSDYIIGSIGRLEKAYVEPLISELAAYFNAHPDKRYTLLLIGGSANQSRVSWINAKIAECPNVTLVRTGGLYPIPADLVRKVDLFISAAGSAIVPYYEGVPSIRIHHATADIIGIIGADYMPGANVSQVVSREKSIAKCIDLIFERKIPITFDETLKNQYEQDMSVEFHRHLLFGDDTISLAHYDVLQVRYPDLKYRLFSILCRIVGAKTTLGLLEIIRKLVRGVD